MYNSLGTKPIGKSANVIVSVGAIASLQRSLLPDALTQFHRQRPDARSHVIPGLSMELVNLVDAGEIDMVAIIRPPFSIHSDHPGERAVPFACSPELTQRRLGRTSVDQAFIRYDRTSFGRKLLDRFLRGMHFSPQEVREVGELDVIVRLVANGLGAALVPEMAAHKRWPAAVRAIDLQEHTFHRDVGLVHRARRSLSEPARLLTKLIVSVAGKAVDEES